MLFLLFINKTCPSGITLLLSPEAPSLLTCMLVAWREPVVCICTPLKVDDSLEGILFGIDILKHASQPPDLCTRFGHMFWLFEVLSILVAP